MLKKGKGIYIFAIIIVLVLFVFQTIRKNDSNKSYISDKSILSDKVVLINGNEYRVVVSSGINCGSCHAQTVSIFRDKKLLITESGSDIRINLVNNNIHVKYQSVGGAPSSNTVGTVKVFSIDEDNVMAKKLNEYQEPYTLKDYEGK